MSSGYVLILAILVLGGVIATLGDRIGTRVGKARLSLFNLRPKKTAVLVTILTGILISATTLGILLLANKQFRDMLLNFDILQRRLHRANQDLTAARSDLNKTADQKQQIEQALERSRQEGLKVQKQLDQAKSSLKGAVELQKTTEARRALVEQQRNVVQNQLLQVSRQALALKSEILSLQSEQRQLKEERDQLIAQREQVRAQIAERDQEIQQRTQLIQQRDREIAQRDAFIVQREQSLRELEGQQTILAQEVANLEEEARSLRLGTPAISRNQVLASGVVRIVNPASANQAVDELLREANRNAMKLVQPGVSSNTQIIRITRSDVEQVIRQISDGKDYFIRILAAANYLLGERTDIVVFPDVARNQVVFQAGDVLATTTLDPSKISLSELQSRINQLASASSFRAQRQGLLSGKVQVSDITSFIKFIDELRQYNSTLEIRAVAGETTYTAANPMLLELVAVHDGQVVFQTKN